MVLGMPSVIKLVDRETLLKEREEKLRVNIVYIEKVSKVKTNSKYL